MKLNENDVKFIDAMIKEYDKSHELTNKLVVSHAVMTHIIYIRRLQEDGKSN